MQDSYSFSVTFSSFPKTLGLAVTFQKFKNFPCFRASFLTLNGSTDTNSRVHQKNMPFALLNYSSLFYIVLTLSSVITYLSNKTLILHDFQGRTIKFHDFPGLENKILNFHDFPGFP